MVQVLDDVNCERKSLSTCINASGGDGGGADQPATAHNGAACVRDGGGGEGDGGNSDGDGGDGDGGDGGDGDGDGDGGNGDGGGGTNEPWPFVLQTVLLTAKRAAPPEDSPSPWQFSDENVASATPRASGIPIEAPTQLSISSLFSQLAAD